MGKIFGPGDLLDFFWMVAGNLIFYTNLALMIHWGKTKRILIRFWDVTFLDWQFVSLFGYVFWATLVTAMFAFFANLAFNYAYIAQGVKNESQWFSQIMTWSAAPLSFIIFSFAVYMLFGDKMPFTFLKAGVIFLLIFLIKAVTMMKF